jgi:phytoene synthase
MDRSLLETLPPPQRLALSYAPARARPATLTLLAFDARLGMAIRQRGEPVLAQMRLAWWRDVLRAAPGEWPAGEPLLEHLRAWHEPASLLPLVDGWEALLGETLDAAVIQAFVSGRAAAFEALAAELGHDPCSVESSARQWALADLAAHLTDAGERAAVLAATSAAPGGRKLPRALRPLAVLAGLGCRSLARGGAPLLDGPAAFWLAVRLGIAAR